jgi:hypothetical protein
MIARISAVVCVIAAAWAAYLQIHGGYDTTVFGVRLRTNNPSRLLVAALVAGGVSVIAYGTRRALARLTAVTAALVRQLARIDDRLIVATLALGLVVVGVRWGAKAAGGADSYGYVSEAELWLSGRLTIPLPWLARIPWSRAERSFSPLGYLPGVVPFEIVPKYSPGLPMLMALAKVVGGQAAIFWVVPLSAGVLVIATFGLARRLGSSHAGMLAVWLLATSPIVLYMLVQPMADIPGAAAWAVAFWCVFGRSVASAAAAGLAVGVAILIRPNLIPMVSVPVLWLVIAEWRGRPSAFAEPSADRRRSILRRALPAAAFVSMALPGILAIAALNKLWYGSPFRSGYETFDDLFGWSNIVPNLKNYALWFVETQTPLALLGVVALLWPWRTLWPKDLPRGPFVVIALFVLAVWAEYCAYVVFDTWWYLRFLLPCWPFLMLGLAVVLLRPARSGGPALTVSTIVVALAIGLHGLWLAQHNLTFELQRGEDKYPTVAKLVQGRTDPNSIVMSTQHSGSIRYYGGRMTLSFSSLAPNMLDRAVQWFTERGVHSYAVLEDWEVAEFKTRFGDENVMGRLLMSPTLIYRGSSTVYLYDFWRPAGSADRGEVYVDPPSKPILCLAPVPLNAPMFK